MYILQTTRKTWPRRCARKKNFKSTFRVSSQISVDLHIYVRLVLSVCVSWWRSIYATPIFRRDISEIVYFCRSSLLIKIGIMEPNDFEGHATRLLHCNVNLIASFISLPRGFPEFHQCEENCHKAGTL